MKVPTYTELRDAITRLGFVFFASGAYDLNLVGIRNRSRRADEWDDLVAVSYLDERGRGRVLAFDATTDPGLTYLRTPTRRDGTACMVPGQYRGLYKVGLHNRSRPGREYRALEQHTDAAFIRDNDRDATLDIEDVAAKGGVFRGNIKANIHRAARDGSDRVGSASAACQVLRHHGDFALLMGVVDAQIAAGYGDVCTYTLLDEQQLIGVDDA